MGIEQCLEDMKHVDALSARIIRIFRELAAIKMRQDVSSVYTSRDGTPVVSHGALSGIDDDFKPCKIEDALVFPGDTPQKVAEYLKVELLPYLPALEAGIEKIIAEFDLLMQKGEK